MIGRPSEEIKTYEEVIGEAVAKLPLLSTEWTNYNVSDPGITMLQNFSAFHVIQESSIREITEQVRRNLLKLMEFTAGVSRPGHAFLVPTPENGPFYLPAHQRIPAGETFFETVKEESASPGGLSGVWLEESGTLREVTYLLKSETIGAVSVFGGASGSDSRGASGGDSRGASSGDSRGASSGVPRGAAGEDPVPGNGIWLVFDRMPDPGEEIALYFAVDEGKRNPFASDHIPEFAKLSWQCFTTKGWERVETIDETAHFLTGGRVRFTIPANGAKRFQDQMIDGYVIRCRLVKSSYDRPPVIRAVYDHVIEVEQKRTLAAMFRFDGVQMVIPSAMARDGAMEVYVQEREHENYRRYERGDGGQTNRFYRLSADVLENPVVEINWAADRFEDQPAPQSVVVVCWAKDAVLYRNLGTVYGYDDQIMEIEHAKQIIPEGFCVMAKMKNRDGTEEYRFAVPGMDGEDDLGYELLSREGSLRIYHPGYRRECQLYLASCAVVRGGAGTLRQGSRLNADGTSLVSVSPERGGAVCESVEELEKRFAEELSHPQTAVTAGDYEEITRRTPGLCIDQVKAWMNEEENRVEIAVKPSGRGAFPRLSDLYKREIHSYLEPRRMTSTEIILTGPKYVSISLHGRIRGKKRFGDCQGLVTRFLKRRFEELASKAGFGGAISFHLLYRELEELDCVAEVCDLEAYPQRSGAGIHGGEIRLDHDCLGYLGDVKMEIIY